MAEIEAIVSDFGGVLTTPLLPTFLKMQDEIGVATGDFGKALKHAEDTHGVNPLFAMERGEISEAEFLDQLGDGLEPLVGHRPHLHRFRELFIGDLDVNPPMIQLMRELKDEGLRMAMLTNNVREWEPTWRGMLPVDEIFETVIDSAFVGCRKPEVRIYEITVERFGLPAEAWVLVDDILVNCEGAREFGMSAVHFQDNEQAIAELRGLLAPA
ncbi:MAG: HAD family phosphatase [Solirubrobacterales bacterium]|nr:HAD family phosphatase [Solirubrobacterales bacterium]